MANKKRGRPRCAPTIVYGVRLSKERLNQLDAVVKSFNDAGHAMSRNKLINIALADFLLARK